MGEITTSAERMKEINAAAAETYRIQGGKVFEDNLARVRARVDERRQFAVKQLREVYRAAEKAHIDFNRAVRMEPQVQDWSVDLTRWLDRPDLIAMKAEQLRTLHDLETFARRHAKLLEVELHLLGEFSQFFPWPED